jgi:catechol 2,3-dioxygenase-like lactoylglutathione lyase family enzyme
LFADVLGLEVAGNAASGYAEVRLGDATIALHRGAMTELTPHGGTLLQLLCADVDAEVVAIRSRGGDVPVGPDDTDWGSRHAYVRGPGDVLVEIARPL